MKTRRRHVRPAVGSSTWSLLMIRQICLTCYKMTELSDDAAGREVACPHCGKPIAVPAKYNPGVADGGGLAPTAAPGEPHRVPTDPTPAPGAKPMSSDPFVPPPGVTPPPAPLPPPGTVAPAATPPGSAAEHGGFGFTLNPAWLAWVPLGCLLAAFVLSFFTWAKLAPGGYTVLTQNGWEAAFGGHDGAIPSGDDVREPNVKEWKDLEASFETRLKTDLLVMPYILLLLPVVALAVIERVVNPATTTLPGPLMWIPQVWPYLLYILGGLTLLLLLLVGFASLRGFGIERATREVAEVRYKEKLDAGPTGSELRKVNILVGQETAKFGPRQSAWLNLLLVFHVLAVLALAARLWLNARGPTRSLPRVGVTW
jgi:DNA-directed RNA polymerase subunit RPC12/RpoP